MYTIGSTAGIAESYRGNFAETFSGWAHNSFIALFSGPVPADHASAPFDTANPFEIFQNLECSMEFTADLMRDNNTRMRYHASPKRTFKANNLPYLEQQYDKWSYTPRTMLLEWAFNDMINGNYEGMKEIYGSQVTNNMSWVVRRSLYMNALYQGHRWLWNRNRVRDHAIRDNEGYGFYSYYGMSSNRNAGNIYPLVMEFDEPITVDSLEYYRGWFSSNANSAALVTIDYWDAALNDGAGDWVEHETVTLLEEGTETAIQFTVLQTEVTAQRFRLRLGDTASSPLNFSWIRFLSSTPPVVVLDTQVDLTWGLVLPYKNALARWDEYLEPRSWSTSNGESSQIMINGDPHPSLHKIPTMLVDVGGPHGTETVKLTKATGVAQGEVPELLSFVLEFFD